MSDGHIIKHLSTGLYVCEVVLKRRGEAASIDLTSDLSQAHVFPNETEARRTAAKWLGAHDYELVDSDADPDCDEL